MLAEAKTLLRLERPEWRCLLQAIASLWRVRLGFWLGGYRATRDWIERRMAACPPTGAPGLSVRTVTRMIALGARFVPGTTCLVKALAAQLLLRLEGHESVLHIGVSKEGISAFEAHAWLEVGGTAVVGGEVSSKFAVLHRRGPRS